MRVIFSMISPLTVIACCRWVTFPVSLLYLVSVLRPRPQQLRPRRDVLLLRPLSHPSHAALPVVEEAHHTVTAGGFILYFLLSGIMSIQIRGNSSKNQSSYKNEVKLQNVPNLLRPDLVCIFSFSKVFWISRTWQVVFEKQWWAVLYQWHWVLWWCVWNIWKRLWTNVALSFFAVA